MCIVTMLQQALSSVSPELITGPKTLLAQSKYDVRLRKAVQPVEIILTVHSSDHVRAISTEKESY